MECNLEKLKMPTFFKKMILAIFTVISGLSGIISFLISEYSTMEIHGLPLNWLIFISTIIILSCIYIFLYCKDIKKFYDDYEKQFNEINKLQINNNSLITNIERRKEEIENLKRKILEYDFIINNIISRIQQGACNITTGEYNYLVNLYNILLQDRNALLKSILKEKNYE